MKRTYVTPHEAYNGSVRSVELIETYEGSCHWWVLITPEGYGENPDRIELCRRDDDKRPIQEEGYGWMRIEIAAHIAAALTGADHYMLTQAVGRSEAVAVKHPIRKQG